MVPSRRLAFLDTTEFSENSRLDTPAWASLTKSTRAGRLALAISEITVLELSRQVHEKAQKHTDLITDAVKKLGDHHIDVQTMPEVQVAEFDADLRARLVDAGVLILPIPSIGHEEVVRRDIDVRKPFRRGGTGYRDSLIWLTFLGWLRSKSGLDETDVYFISANHADFGGENGKSLHKDLVTEVAQTANVLYLNKLADLARIVREANPPTEESLRPSDDAGTENPYDVPFTEDAAVAQAVTTLRALIGFPFNDLPVEEPFVAMPPVEEGWVAGVEVQEDTVDAYLVDTVSETEIWEVRVTAVLEVQGHLRRADIYPLPANWNVSQDDFDERFVEVTGNLEGTFVADVRVEADATTTDGALVGVIFRGV